MATRLNETDLAALLEPLLAETETARSVPRQPVHTLYGGAHLYSAGAVSKLGALAREAFSTYLPDPVAFSEAFGLVSWDELDELKSALRHSPSALPPALQAVVALFERVRGKLQTSPIEDLRVDFEDGYGFRPAEEEDAHATAAGRAMGEAFLAGQLPPFVGIRPKALTRECARRSLRTLEFFLGALLETTAGRVPAGFVVTLPKVETPKQVEILSRALDMFERSSGLAASTLSLELMVETPRALVSAEGRLALPGLVAAGDGRCVAVHFGAYDYTSLLEIAAQEQRLSHPACQLARQLMQLSLAGAPVRLSDGATNILPIPRHKAPAGGTLSPTELSTNREVVFRAWRLHFEHVQAALKEGFYQGWDLHPAQLVARYAAVFQFFRTGLDASRTRLKVFLERAAQASRVGEVFDDSASAQGLLNFFLRGLSCGAVTEEELKATGLSRAELELRSFSQLLRVRGLL